MRVKLKPKVKRGVYRNGDKQVLIVNWDSQHPCPSLSEWHYCEQCDFTHPLGGHWYFSPACELFFVLDEIAGELVHLGLIGRVKK
jgi:hypothetical protein